MGLDKRSDRQKVSVPLDTIQEIEKELVSFLDVIDHVVRLRATLLRLLRVVRELDPDKTPIHPVTIDPSKAYRTSESSDKKTPDSILTGPRFGDKRKDD